MNHDMGGGMSHDMGRAMPKEGGQSAFAAIAEIVAGKISVHDYMSDNKCPQ